MFDYFDVAAQPAVVVVDTTGSPRTVLGAIGSDELDALVRDALA